MHTPKSKGVPQESPGLLRVIQPRVPEHQHGRRALWSPPQTRKAVRLRHSRLFFDTRPCICHRNVGCFYTVSFVIADVGVPKLSRVAGPLRESALDQKTLEGAVYGGRSRLSIAARRAVTESVSRQLNRTPTRPMLPHAKQGSQTIIILVLISRPGEH